MVIKEASLEVIATRRSQYPIDGKPEFLLYENEYGKLLRENAHIFLSQRAIGSFGGYAGQQLNRMLNALARDRVEQREKEEHILRSVKSAMGSFNERFTSFGDGSINLMIDESKKENLETNSILKAVFGK